MGRVEGALDRAGVPVVAADVQARQEAYRAAQAIRGAADSAATKVYADAFGRDPEFYSLLRTLESYKATMQGDETLVLSTQGEFYKYLKGSR